MFTSAFVFVCLPAGLHKNYLDLTDFYNIRWVTHEPRSKPLDFGGNPNHIMLGLEIG